MAKLEDIITPFVKCSMAKLMAALKTGQKSGEDLISNYRVCKTVRQITNVAGVVNRLDGLRVRVHGLRTDPKAMWEMVITNPTSVLIKGMGGATSALIDEVASESVPVASLKKIKIQGKQGSYIPPAEFAFVCDSVEEGDNVYLVGPTGSGKTEMAVQASKASKRHYIRQNFNRETTVENLIGYTEIGVEEGVSVTEWHDGELARAVKLASKGEKVVYVADEVNAGLPEVLFQFHRVLETDKDTGERQMEINGELFKIPKGNLAIVACANAFRADETGMYQGTNTLNMAFLNRFTGGVFFVDYPPNEDEIMVLSGIDKPIARLLHDFAKKVRAESEAQNYGIICSTRQVISIGKKAMSWGCKRALVFCYVNTLTSDERKVIDPVIKSFSWPS